MPRNGSGTYSPPAGTAAVSLQPIASVPYNAFVTDLSSEMTNSLPTTGVKAMGANLPMGGNQIKNMADPTVSTDAATKNYVDNITHGKIVAIQVLTTTGTYTRSANATQGDIYVQGGGPSSGGCGATTGTQGATSAAGPSGTWCISLNVALPATATVTIGAAGAAPAAGANPGNPGGQTSFVGGSINMVAPGGTAGVAGAPFTIAGLTALGNPVLLATQASGGNFVNTQGNISPGGGVANGTLISSRGGGGYWGGGGDQNAAATAYGGAGGGSVNGSSASALPGRAGFAGVVVVVERT